MSPGPTRFAAAFLTLLLSWGCGGEGPVPTEGLTLNLRSSATGHAVEGALIFAPGERTVHRSDVNGKVVLPAGYGAQGLRIHAKNHRPAEIQLLESSGDVLLDWDDALVNPGEARMVFDRADTLRGSYGPYRANNDLLTYDLDIRVDVQEKFISGGLTTSLILFGGAAAAFIVSEIRNLFK